jgi:hypothetical protein
MRERVAVYDGEFSAVPRPGGGFRVAVRLPLSGGDAIDRIEAAAGPAT